MRSFYPPKSVQSAIRRMLRRARAIEPRYRHSFGGGKPAYGQLLPVGRQELAKDVIRFTVNDHAIQKILLKRNESLIKQLKLNQQNREFNAMTASYAADKIANYAIGKFGGNKEKAIQYLRKIEVEILEFGKQWPKEDFEELRIATAKKGLSEEESESYVNQIPHTIRNIQQFQILSIIFSGRYKIKRKQRASRPRPLS